MTRSGVSRLLFLVMQPAEAGLMGIITLEDVLECLLQEQIYDENDVGAVCVGHLSFLYSSELCLSFRFLCSCGSHLVGDLCLLHFR